MSFRKGFWPKVSRKSSERLEIYLNETDYVNTRGRGRWKATITDIDSKISYRVAGCACSIPHYMCDAYIVEQLPRKEE